LLVGLIEASAQDATPGPLPTAPAPAECRVAPRSVEAVETILATAGTPSPELDVENEGDLPRGQNAPAETIAEVVAVEREFAACYNGGDWPRLLALFADETLPAFFDGGETPRALFATTGTPATDAIGVQKVVLVAVRNVRILADGRIGAVVEWGRVGELSRGPAEANFHIYVRVADRLLLADEIGGFVPWYQGQGTPPAWQTDATPVS
jgi:hypothetical protein